MFSGNNSLKLSAYFGIYPTLDNDSVQPLTDESKIKQQRQQKLQKQQKQQHQRQEQIPKSNDCVDNTGDDIIDDCEQCEPCERDGIIYNCCRVQKNVWHERRMRMLSRRCKLKKPGVPCEQNSEQAEGLNRQVRSAKKLDLDFDDSIVHGISAGSYHVKGIEDEDDGGDVNLDQTDDIILRENIVNIVNHILARNEEKRRFGMGLVGKWLNRKYKQNLTKDQLNFLAALEDQRPYFTYWVTTVQILILIISMLTYGLAPFGMTSTQIKDYVQVTSLSWQKVSYLERDNLWLGPRAADLIHLGAKFTPCMRKDRLAYDVIEADRHEEQFTGCCIRNDQSGCLQTHREGCSYLQSKWHSWNITTSDGAPPMFGGKKRTSGPVCGQDPKYCTHPASVYPHEWPDDITKWPICVKQSESLPSTPSHHMGCELVGRPCCIGIHGQCKITTSQHCSFLRGTFHPEATLCSQVSCMQDVCGMIPFYARDYPDQIYRPLTALFLHAGIFHFCLTLVIQGYIMRDLERLIGASRMAIIYLVSGFTGYLASAIFVPYHTQVGPSGSQFALLALLIAELINSWDYIDRPHDHLFKYLGAAFSLFIVGLLPWIDNYAHVFGFITGLLLSFALVPFLAPVDSTKYRVKVIQVWVCILTVFAIIIVLLLHLYVFPIYECSWCQYFDCLPLFPDWCTDQTIRIGRLDIL